MPKYDLVVLGSGPAGEKGASTAAITGRKVAVIEREPVLGGASTNTGTLPSKTLRETALALSGLRARDLYGVDLSLRREATIRDFMYHEEHVKEGERVRVRRRLDRVNVELFRGKGAFVDPHTVRVTGGASADTILEAEKILIATGSTPYHPPEFDFTDGRIHDSDELLTIERLPKVLAVVGAGVIGCEYACTFAALACEVHLIDGRDSLLPFLDKEVSQSLEEAIENLGIQFHKNEQVTGCPITDDGQVKVTCESGHSVIADQVLISAGRTSNTGHLNLEAAGVTTGKRGLIPVNVHYQTNVPHIYAAGDVIGFPALSATSAAQGRIAMCHAFTLGFEKDLAPLLPTGIYTIPEVSCVGETEESLKEKNIDYLTGKARYRNNARGEIMGDDYGFLKLLFRREDMKLLGVHVIGERASEVVHTGMMVMLTGNGADLLSRACFNYPTLGDLYKDATHNALLTLHNLNKDGGAD
ncbi:MAG: Si-specific NAD(P)(+) transhydrogenase [Bryobacterales bacterium]|nr:Si-specific NAD(P)(+) transhydrogenase [Bryobacterales bacterium]